MECQCREEEFVPNQAVVVSHRQWIVESNIFQPQFTFGAEGGAQVLYVWWKFAWRTVRLRPHAVLVA